ncbi:MAG: prepilin peptidase [Elusimicrobia bacterium]|nr:prepilin peptidase [Elusimicrobiota bacterium]
MEMNTGPLTPLVKMLLSGMAGAALGSFANVCICRVPRGESVVFPGSHCPGCRAPIPWYRNIPLLSFLLLRGRCAGCRRPISCQYPLVEALTGLLFALLAGRWSGTSFVFWMGAVFTLVLVIVSGIDYHLKIIPDVFSLGLLGAGLVLTPLNPLLAEGLAARVLHGFAGALTGFSLMWTLGYVGTKTFGKEALGGGDVKLMAGVGSLLGASGVFAAVFAASLFGTVLFLAMKALRRMAWGTYLPFGPFLAAGAWIYLMFPGVWDRWWAF